MAARISILLMLFSTLIGNSQNITLLKNFNPKVKELKHNLNQNKDSLKLECENKIFKVEIFNEDYEHTFNVEDTKANIPLQKLPEGKFVVEVYLANKIAEMHIVKYKNNSLSNSNANDDVVEGKGMMLDEELKVIKRQPKHSIEFLLTRTNTDNKTAKKEKFYWVILEINNGNSSYKSMKLVEETMALKMINKNKLEAKSSYGKLNKLTVWEIYDKAEFMKNQLSNPEYINSTASDSFNVKPYYTSTNKLIALN